MNNLEILLATLLLADLVFLVAIFFILRTLRKIYNARGYFKALDRLKKEAIEKEEEVLSKALEESKASVHEAIRQLSAVQELSYDVRNQMEQEAKRLVDETITKYSEVFQNNVKDIADSYLNGLRSLSTAQLNESSKILNLVKQAAEEEIRKLKEESLKVAEVQRAKVEAEIADYKQKKVLELDGKIHLLIEDVARETIGKSIDLETHQELVMLSFERAKKELF